MKPQRNTPCPFACPELSCPVVQEDHGYQARSSFSAVPNMLIVIKSPWVEYLSQKYSTKVPRLWEGQPLTNHLSRVAGSRKYASLSEVAQAWGTYWKY